MKVPESPELPPHIYVHARRLRVDTATEEVVGALEMAGIRSILLKGPSIARWLYDEQDVRNYSDIDLLVGPQQMAEAERVLTQAGFVFSDPPLIPGDRPHHADSWIRHRDGAAVDLHRTIIGAQAPPVRVWGVLSGRTDRMQVRGHDVDVLDIPARCVQIALHAAHHGAQLGHTLSDLERALDRVEIEIWREAAAVAAEIDALGAYCVGLSLRPNGQQLLSRLSLFAPPSVEAALRVEGAPAALGLEWVITARSPIRKLELLVRKTFPPPDYIRDWAPFSTEGAFGLIRGYLWRVVFLFINFVPAMRALRRARRESGRSPDSYTRR